MLWVCGMLLWVQKGIADEIKPLRLSKGQKYELRISNISVVCPGPEKIEFEKTVNQDLYEFEVKEVHRKEGYVLEMKHCRSDMYVFRKFPDDPLWYEVNFRNSEIHAPALASGEVQGYMEKYPFVVRLTSDFRIPDSLKVKKWFTPLLAEAFAGGKQAIYRMTDTLLKQEAGFCEKETEVRFTLSDTLPFVVTFGEEDCRVGVLNRTNTRLRGEIKHAQGVEYILLDMSTLLPFYEDRIYRIPVVNGKFDFRLQLEQPMEYIKMLGGYYLYLEPGDDLVMEIDSLTDREIRFSGLGAGNNRYYHREISGWWDSLSRLRQEKTNCREFYMALESMEDEYSHRIATLKYSFTLTF